MAPVIKSLNVNLVKVLVSARLVRVKKVDCVIIARVKAVSIVKASADINVKSARGQASVRYVRAKVIFVSNVAPAEAWDKSLIRIKPVKPKL